MPIDTRSAFAALTKLLGGGEPSIAPNGNEIDPLWKQQLQQMADPAQQKRRAIAQALASGSRALMTTPGHFGTGLAQGLGAGAEEYHKQRDVGERTSLAAYRSLWEQLQDERETRINRLKDYLSAARGVNEDARQTADSAARQEYYKRRPTQRSGGSGLTSRDLLNQRNKALEILNSEYGAAIAVGLSPEEQAAMEARKQQLFLERGLTADGMRWAPGWNDTDGQGSGDGDPWGIL